MNFAARRLRPLLWGMVCVALSFSRALAQAPAAAEEIAPLDGFASVLRADPTSREPLEIEIKSHFNDVTAAQLRAIGKCSELERLVFRAPPDRLDDQRTVTDLPTLVEHLLPLKKLKSLAIGLARPRFGGPRVVRDADLARLARLTSLEELDLSRQPLTGEGLKHLIAMPNLESLILDETSAGDESLEGLGKLAKLKRLSLKNTPLNTSADLPIVLSIFLQQRRVNLPNLMMGKESASLYGELGNQLSLRYLLPRHALKGLRISTARDEDLELLADCPTLEVLEISSPGHLTEKGLRWLPRQQRLKVLHLESSGLDAGRLQILAELPALELLRIGPKQVKDGSDYLGEISSLRELQLTGGEGGYKNLTGIAKCKSLEKLSLEFGLPASPSELKFLAGLENLQHLSLREVDARGLLHLPHPEKLQHLRLVSWNRVEAEQLRGLAKLANLESLTLVGAGLSSGDCLPAFTGLKKLQSLQLGSFGSSGKMPKRDQVLPLAELKELRKVDLDAVEIGPAGFAALSSLPHLHEIRLRRIELDDRSIPALKSMKKLELLMVNDHQFSQAGRDELFKALTRPDDGPRGVRYGLNDYR